MRQKKGENMININYLSRHWVWQACVPASIVARKCLPPPHFCFTLRHGRLLAKNRYRYVAVVMYKCNWNTVGIALKPNPNPTQYNGFQDVVGLLNPTVDDAMYVIQLLRIVMNGLSGVLAPPTMNFSTNDNFLEFVQEYRYQDNRFYACIIARNSPLGNTFSTTTHFYCSLLL